MNGDTADKASFLSVSVDGGSSTYGKNADVPVEVDEAPMTVTIATKQCSDQFKVSFESYSVIDCVL